MNDIMKKISLILSNQTMLDYKSFLVFMKQHLMKTSNEEHKEFEIRFQNLSKNKFDKLKQFIEIDKYYINKSEISSVSTVMPNGIRKETFGKPNTKDFTEIYQKKQEIKSMKMLINNISVKFNLSSEINVNPNIIKIKDQLMVRTKNRTRYEFDLYYIDLTIVNTVDNINNNRFDTYEIEIEFKKTSGDRPNYGIYENGYPSENDISIPLKYILKMLNPERISFTDDVTENYIRKEYIKMFPSVNTRGKQNYIYENKPVNFKLEDVNNFNHSITNKLNGINFFLFFNYQKSSIYLINHSTVEYIGKDNLNKIKGNMLIQGELFFNKDTNNYTYYIFDVLIVNDENVTNNYHRERLDKFFPYFNIIDENLFYSTPQIRLQYKTFYGINGIDKNNINDNFYNNLMQCKNSLVRDINGNIDMEINDGFIFTPINKPYINRETYKYKFPETMTIDFLVRTGGNTLLAQDDILRGLSADRSIVPRQYELFVYNENDKMVPFFYKRKYNMECDKKYIICNEIQNENIVECFFDKEKQVFLPYRVRHDKVKPNFYKIAENVFKDILEPITLVDLEKIFYEKFSRDKPSPKLSPKPSPKLSPKPSPKLSPKPSPKLSPKPSPKLSPKPSPKLSPKPEQNKYLKLNASLKIKLNNILECVLYSVSPEYRNYKETDENEVKLMFETAVEYLNENGIMFENLKEIDRIADMFNIKITLVKELKEPMPTDTTEYKILSSSKNDSDNLLYISVNTTELQSEQLQNIEYNVLGYKVGKYNVFIF